MDFVDYEITDGIAQVRLTRADKRNALTLQTLRELKQTAETLRKDRALRAVVLSGEGADFCAGLDFGSVMKDSVGIARSFVPHPLKGTNLFQEAPWAWRRIPVPVIAAVQGNCLGGGLQIALAADFRYSTPDAQWSVLEGKWGIIPDMSGVQSLKEVVGIDTAKRLTMTAAFVSGKDARDLGLVTAVDSDPVAAATEFARELAQRSPDQLAAAKRLFNDTWMASARRTFSRERLEQLPLLFAANTKIAQKAAREKVAAQYRNRRR